MEGKGAMENIERLMRTSLPYPPETVRMATRRKKRGNSWQGIGRRPDFGSKKSGFLGRKTRGWKKEKLGALGHPEDARVPGELDMGRGDLDQKIKS